MPTKMFLQGNEACAYGALAAGCRFFAFYPITPASEIAYVMAREMPKRGGICIQMEDEIASLASAIGASWAGAKAMTATSGPGFSLMQEGIGYASMTETPCVIVDVERAGPSTGTPALPMQGDVYQSRRGSHGEYPIIVLAPNSAQEMFDLTIEAFNLSEAYRTPVVVLSDALIGHLREEVVMPEGSEIKLVNRRTPEPGSGRVRAFLDEDVAPMPIFGTGHSAHVTGSTHDEYGMREVSDPKYVHKVVVSLRNKIQKRAKDIAKVEMEALEGSELALVSFGSVSRSASHVVKILRSRGTRVGSIRLITLWPFPDEAIERAAKEVPKLLVLENNLGQVVNEVERAARGRAEVAFLPPATVASIHSPDFLMRRIEELMKK
ncbi:MAG: 2-oxoacid:acceptor oxidoreductase subunit alpha [Candidatus Bathyarchaeia archaeon]